MDNAKLTALQTVRDKYRKQLGVDWSDGIEFIWRR
jgi:hypothetical protein